MYETKAAFRTAADIILTSKTLKEAYERLAKIANVESVVVPEKFEKEDESGS